jgi:hypothetical protein
MFMCVYVHVLRVFIDEKMNASPASSWPCKERKKEKSLRAQASWNPRTSGHKTTFPSTKLTLLKIIVQSPQLKVSNNKRWGGSPGDS